MVKTSNKKVIVEIQLPTTLEVYPEEAQSKDDFKTAKAKKELAKFQKKVVKDIQTATKDLVKDYMESFEEYFMDNCDDVAIEGFDTLKDYGIKVKVK